MKIFTMFFILASATLNLANANASTQEVITRRDGPAVFAEVYSSDVHALMIGYSKSGYLNQFGTDYLSAIITAKCYNSSNGTWTQKMTTISLGKEYHGAGYLTGPQSISDLASVNCTAGNLNSSFDVAFSDGQGHWDSKNGQNYFWLTGGAFVAGTQYFNTNQSGSNVVQAAWDFISQQMQ